MKVLLISHEMTYTGAPNSLLNIARVFKKYGHNVGVYTLHEGKFERQFHKYGFKVKRLRPDTLKHCCQELSEKYDLAICNTVFCSRICCILQDYMKTILYIREAEDLPQILSDNGIDASYIQNAENIVCVSEYARKFIAKHYSPKKICVLNNFLMTGKNVYPLENKIRGRKLHFLVAATIEPRKGIDVAINAFQSLPRHLSEKAVLDIVGKKAEWAKEYWQDLFRDSESRIIYHGEYTGRKKNMYQKANVVLVPSFDEACSLVALEAARYGRPLIVTKNVGASYLVNNGGGFVVKTGSVTELADAMRFFIENMGSIDFAGMVVCQRFRETSMCEPYYERLEKIVSEVI